MKKLALATAAVLTLLSIAGCGSYVGKGKAPLSGVPVGGGGGWLRAGPFLLAVPRGGAVPMASRTMTQASVCLRLPIENQTHAAQQMRC